MFWSQYSPKEIIQWNKASLSIFLAHYVTATFSRHKLKWAKRDSFHRVLLLHQRSNPAPVLGHVHFQASLGRWRSFCWKAGNCLPRNGRKELYFWLDPSKRVIENTEQHHFVVLLGILFLSFTQPSLLILIWWLLICPIVLKLK